MNVERNIVVGGLTLLPIYGAVLATIWNSNPAITAENGPMENLQAGALAIACLVLIPSISRQGSRIPRFSCWFLFLLFTAFFLREVDVEELAIPPLLASLGGGTGRDIVMGTAFGLTTVYLLKNSGQLFPSMIRSIATGPGMLLLAGCALYASSWPFDKGILPVTGELTVFGEEVVECGATFMLLACAICASVTNYLDPLGARPDQASVDRHDSGNLAGEHRRAASFTASP